MKKGFTLIELLAVIVILAILALIVTPIISGVISDAKKSAAARSLEGYVQAVELAEVKYQTNNQGNVQTDITKLSIEGKSVEKVTSPEVTITSSGIVSTASAVVDGFNCTYNQSTGAVCEG